VNEQELPLLAGIGALIRWCEELASLLAGPVLTLGLGIALVDLFTDGKLLATTPALLFAWAVSQTVGLDAQLVGSAAKLGAAIRRRAGWSILGYALLVCALGYVAFQASNVFATQQAEGITTAAALARLGMDSATWIIERSALAVVLVVLSGLLRYVAPAKVTASLADERAALERQLELEPLRQRLRAQQVGGWRSVAVTALQGAGVAQSAQTLDNASTPFEASQRLPTAAPAPILAAQQTTPDASDGPDTPPDGPGSGHPASKPASRKASAANVTPLRRARPDRRTAARANARSGKRGRAEQRIRAALAQEPDITPERLATRAGVSSSTVSKWLAVIEAEGRAGDALAQ
jgi:hypothetical protein